MNNYDWLDKKTPRIVENLKLWPENPRLNPEENHIRVSDFVEDLITENSDKESFLELIKSIVQDGFRPFDPIIIWKSEDDEHHYVAEGNRRVLALKLLLNPSKAPKSIRGTVRKYSELIDKETIKKVKVNVAPNFEEAEWYINQRNNASSLQRTWTRIQQQRWILELYSKYDGDIEIVSSKTKMTQSQLENYIRPLKIRDFIFDEEMKKHMTEEEINTASSIKFPITILERFFSNEEARKKFRLEFDGFNVNYSAEKNSFYIAFADLIKKIIYRETIYKNSEDRIDTRTITSNFETILKNIPDVNPLLNNEPEAEPENPNPSSEPSDDNENRPSEDKKDDGPPKKDPIQPVILKNNPDRNNLVLKIYDLETDSYRLKGLFEEFKKISLTSYKNSIAVSMRVFLDLAVYKHIETENLQSEIERHCKLSLKEIPLKHRLEFLKTKNLSQASKNIIGTLLKTDQQYSIDVLNGYVHGQATHYLQKTFLNSFWDYLFPLFQQILVIKEKK